MGQGRNVWMRIEAGPADLPHLTATGQRIPQEEFWRWCSGFLMEDARAVGWQQIRTIRKPISYQWHFGPSPGQGRYGVLALDPDRSVLYVLAGAL